MGLRVTGVPRRRLEVLDYIEKFTQFDDMHALQAEADHLALCLPLTPRTDNIFDERRVALLKPGAYVYNIGRGELIDQDAMIDALQSGCLAGAGLDVVTHEPLPADSPL